MAQVTTFLSLLDTTSAERRPMTEDETRSMLEAVLLDQANEDPVLDPELLQGTIAYPTLALRLRLAGIEVTLGACHVVMSWSGMRPGCLVLWAYTAVCIARKTGRNLVTIDDLASEFPFGIPTSDGSRRIWEAQKIDRDDAGTDNGLDLETAWK